MLLAMAYKDKEQYKQYRKVYDKLPRSREMAKERYRKYHASEKGQAYKKAYRAKPEVKERRRRQLLAKRYNISLEDVANECQICGLIGKMYVDHNHETGKVRGFLCRNCNLALGYVKDSVKLLTNAIAYLEKTDGPD